MSNVEIKATKREKHTKGGLNELRNAGKIPAVVYGKENRNISIKQTDFQKTIDEGGQYKLLDVDFEGKKIQVIIKDYSIDFINRKFTHVDFQEVENGKDIKIYIPLHLNGTPEGVRLGGVLDQSEHKLQIKCKPEHMPSEIAHDVSKMKVGSILCIKDLAVPEHVKILDNPKHIVAVITGASKLKEKVSETEETETAEASEETANA